MTSPRSTTSKTKFAEPAIIPVMDLMIGQVVLARGGHRDQYTPIHTRLTKNSYPLHVARAMFGQTGCNWIYLADLDCFEGAKPALSIYREILEVGFGLWVDADWLRGSRVELLDEFKGKNFRPIISTESMTSEDQLTTLKDLADQGFDPIFSVDVKGEQVITQAEPLADCSPREIVVKAIEHGVNSVIFLNLKNVGTDAGSGVTADQIRLLAEEFPELHWISGGGVGALSDAEMLIDAGCEHVLVASAIHDCKFRPDDVTELNSRRK